MPKDQVELIKAYKRSQPVASEAPIKQKEVEIAQEEPEELEDVKDEDDEDYEDTYNSDDLSDEDYQVKKAPQRGVRKSKSKPKAKEDDRTDKKPKHGKVKV